MYGMNSPLPYAGIISKDGLVMGYRVWAKACLTLERQQRQMCDDQF